MDEVGSRIKNPRQQYGKNSAENCPDDKNAKLIHNITNLFTI